MTFRMTFLAILIALVLVFGGHTAARQTLPTQLLQQADLTLVGTFLANDNIWDNGENGAFALGANNDTILLSGWTGSTFGLGEQTIPAIGGVSSVVKTTGGNLAAQMSQVGADCGNGYITGGQLAYNNRQYVTVATYYDTCNGAQKSLFSSALTGPVTLGAASTVGTIGASFTSGYMGHIPSEWQSVLGGPVGIGQCCLSIITRTSYGPALFAFNPESPATAHPLVYYDSSHQTLGAGFTDGQPPNPQMNASTRITGVAMIPSTATALFIGNTGLGPIVYGGGTYDIAPYVGYVWAYDMHEFAAVRAGTKQPWQVVPYATFELPGYGSAGKEFSGSCGAGYDPAKQLLYVCKPYGTVRAPRIYVYAVNVGAPPPPPPPPPDSDGDGVPDSSDACPTVAANTPDGCPLPPPPPADTDGDGVPDSSDACPTVAANTPDGCPAPPPPPANQEITEAVMEIRTCRLTLRDVSPFTGGGGTVQFRRNDQNHGNADSVAPYERSANVGLGTYAVTGIWTKSGEISVTRTLKLISCGD